MPICRHGITAPCLLVTACTALVVTSIAQVWENGNVTFVADDLAAWLVGLVADAGRKKLTALLLGDQQERELSRAATAAVLATALELGPSGVDATEHLAMVISEVFEVPAAVELTGQLTMLEALRAGVAAQVAVLGCASMTGRGESWAEIADVDVQALAQQLSDNLVREIMVRGAQGGVLAPLANQFNHDLAHLQNLQLELSLSDLRNEVRSAMERERRGIASQPNPILRRARLEQAQLPPRPIGFTGRHDEMAILAGLLDPGAGHEAVLVSAAGLAGVGKTALAVAAGHGARDRGWFAGGSLFIDLHGYDSSALLPGQALDTLLRALGIEAEDIPPGTEERAALYRSVLARIRDPLLIIADNASSETQVRPLLPGTGPHRVVVTSRNTLAGLHARLLDITVLDSRSSIRMLDTLMRSARPEDTRISDDQQAAERLGRACGGLPLALQIVAALLKADPGLVAADLAADLESEHHRLEQLRYDDGADDALSVEAAFELSYRALTPGSRRLFQLLGLVPGPDASTAAVAVLADLTPVQARRMLAGLARAHLVEEIPPRGGRWQMHDLVRLYARRLSDQDAGDRGKVPGLDLLYDYYAQMAAAARGRLQAQPAVTAPDMFADETAGLAWFDAERRCLVAAVTEAHDQHRDEIAVRLSVSLAGYLYSRRRFDDMIMTCTVGLAAAKQLGDRAHEAAALGNLGIALSAMRRLDESISAFKDAVAIFRETGDRHTEALALNDLGGELREVGRFDEAFTSHHEAAAIFREVGDRKGEGMAANNIGAALQEKRRFAEALTSHQDAAVIFREIGDRYEEGRATDNIAMALRAMGRFDEAIKANYEATVIFRETGDRHDEGLAAINLGCLLIDTGRPGDAINAFRNAAVIFRENEDRHSEGRALYNLGLALLTSGPLDEALTIIQEAVGIFRETRDREREAISLTDLGAALLEAGRLDEALTVGQEAVDIARETGDRSSEAAALDDLSATLREAGRLDEALTASQEAAAILRQADNALPERGSPK